MVVLLTPNSVRSPQVRAEISYALGSMSYKNRLIPVAVGGREQLPASEIPWIIRTLPWVDLPNPGSGDPEVKPIARRPCSVKPEPPQVSSTSADRGLRLA